MNKGTSIGLANAKAHIMWQFMLGSMNSLPAGVTGSSTAGVSSFVVVADDGKSFCFTLIFRSVNPDPSAELIATSNPKPLLPLLLLPTKRYKLRIATLHPPKQKKWLLKMREHVQNHQEMGMF